MHETAIVPAAPTTTATPSQAPLKRCAIIGTAPSWAQCPWPDQALEKWGLNDGYLLGVPHAARWYDLHPFHQMSFQSRDRRAVPQAAVPMGAYLRPEGHLEWLKTRGFPVYLAEPHPDYPTARVFPKAQVLDFWRAYWPLRRNRRGTIAEGPDYEVSTPSWMLMQAVAEGYREIHVYGIHLATEWEYVQQRPNFEFLLGVARGLGVQVVLPDSAPICKATYQYAFAPKADLPMQAAQHAIQTIKAEGAKLHQQRAKLAWHERTMRADIEARLRQLDVDLMDARATAQRTQMLAMT